MGGRPPFGYTFEELGAHPHPDKAAIGKKLVRLTPNPSTAPVVMRIFAEYGEGRSVRGIAQLLTDEGVPCPSAADPNRNTHRAGLAWSHGAVRAILLNPTYRGFTVTGRTTKVEVLIDPENPSLGMAQVRTPVPPEQWTSSPAKTHQPLVDDVAWDAARRRLSQPGTEKATTRTRRPKSSDRTYQLSGHVACAICHRRMQGQVNHDAIRYRCRHRDAYAVSDSHPRNVYLNEAAVLPGLDDWMADLFSADRIDETVAFVVATLDDNDPYQEKRDRAAAARRKAERDLQGLLDVARAGGNAAALAAAINDAQAKVDAAKQAIVQCRRTRPAVDAHAVEATIREMGGLLLGATTPDERKQMFAEINLRLTYDPTRRMVHGDCDLYVPSSYVSVGGGTCTLTPRAFRPSEYLVAA